MGRFAKGLAVCLLGISLVLAPTSALATDAPAGSWGNKGPDSIVGGCHFNFQSGALANLIGKVRGTAMGFLPLMLALGVIIEAFGHSPAHPRDYAAVIWRFILISFLLIGYVPIFNQIVVMFDGIADSVSPGNQELSQFWQQVVVDATKAMPSNSPNGVAPGSSPATAAQSPSFLDRVKNFGGIFYDGLVAFVLLVAEAIIIVVLKFGRVIAALLFCLGPLALVGSVPRSSRTATRWFHHFVTLLCWPIVAGMLLSLVLAIGMDGVKTGGYIGAIIAAFLMAAVAIGTPRVSASMVGGAIENLVAQGWQGIKSVNRDAHPVAKKGKAAAGAVVGGLVGTAVRNEEGERVGWKHGVPVRAAQAVVRVFGGGGGGPASNSPDGSGTPPQGSGGGNTSRRVARGGSPAAPAGAGGTVAANAPGPVVQQAVPGATPAAAPTSGSVASNPPGPSSPPAPWADAARRDFFRGPDKS